MAFELAIVSTGKLLLDAARQCPCRVTIKQHGDGANDDERESRAQESYQCADCPHQVFADR